MQMHADAGVEWHSRVGFQFTPHDWVLGLVYTQQRAVFGVSGVLTDLDEQGVRVCP